MSFISCFDRRVFIASGDLIRTFQINEENEIKKFIDWEEINPARIQKPDFNVEKELKVVDKRMILCLAHSNMLFTHGRRLVAVGTNEKQIHVFEYFTDNTGVIVKSEHIVTSVVPKAPTAIAFDKEDAYVVVGDRAGDVYRFSVLNGRAIEMAGAVSMVLDVAFSPDGKRLLMADRDEKVRAIRYPSTYIIDAYFLGHTEYVKTVAVQDNDSLWSSGGDKILYNWSMSDCSKPRQKIDLSEWKSPIRKISFNGQHKKIAVLFENSETIAIVEVDQEPANITTVAVRKESQCLDVAASGKYFVVLTRSTVLLIDLCNMEQKFIAIDDDLCKSLTATNDAVENLFKNVTHNNQQQYEKRKAEKFEKIEQKKRRKPNNEASTSC